jgi:hypothetical protein
VTWRLTCRREPLLQIADVYRKTKKPKDILWNRFVARPLAALLLVPLAKSRITPNQITFLSLLTFVGAHGHAGASARPPRDFIAAILVLELLLRSRLHRRSACPPQAQGVAGWGAPRLPDGRAQGLSCSSPPRAFVCGRPTATNSGWSRPLLGLAVVASAISMTTFIRRPEYLSATGAARPQSAGDYGDGFAAEQTPARSASLVAWSKIWAASSSTIRAILLFVAIADQLDVFLHVYLAINAAYAARSLLGVALKLGRVMNSAKQQSHHRRGRPRPPPGRKHRRDPQVHGAVNGRPILHWQLRAFAAAGIRDIVIVRGYLGDRIDAGEFPVRFVDNPQWEHNNILASLMYARASFPAASIFPTATSCIARAWSPGWPRLRTRTQQAASLIIDRRWADAYQGRTLHPCPRPS